MGDQPVPRLRPEACFQDHAALDNPQTGKIMVDPGYVPDFQKITSIGLDGAGVTGEWSIRGEAVYIINRSFNIRQELWGYPSFPLPGTYHLNSIGVKKRLPSVWYRRRLPAFRGRSADHAGATGPHSGQAGNAL